ncbi:MAG TPA: carboxypeptidase-like regulatory domain-containing protein [Terriglobales bacterium]|nr:carboxypeptidase-like regulatory domain-containing protein [Terriglobales bacterium]
MKSSLKFTATGLILALSSFASAQTLTGTVKNGTSNKPASGDEVVLLNLAQGMEEAARTKTDSKGNFSFKLPAGDAPHLIRVIHQGVTYHRMAPPGTTSVEAEVFDVAKKIEGLNVTADVMRIEADDSSLKVARLFAVDNRSKPPKTQMNDQNFEFYLPDGVTVDSAMAKTAGGQPINATAVPQKEKNRYAFIFPLRPGETQFQVQYHLPYSGSANLDPKPLYGMDHFVVVLPKSMQFSGPASYQSMQDPGQSDSQVEVVSNAQANQGLAFKVSGTGNLPARNESGGEAGGGGMGGGQASGRDSRPGGGLGPPIDAPDPLDKYRWYILGAFAVMLAGGGYYISKRSPAKGGVLEGIDQDETVEVPRPSAARLTKAAAAPATAAPTVTARSNSNHSGLLLQALKEELFELEVERQQGRISQQDYEKAKAALDQTLHRAVKREAQKA